MGESQAGEAGERQEEKPFTFPPLPRQITGANPFHGILEWGKRGREGEESALVYA